MQKKQVAVLDFGSSKLRAIVAERGVNKTFIVKGSAEVDYAGFYDGEFLEPAALPDAVEQALASIKESLRIDLGKVYIGVPGEFTTCILREKMISFPKEKKIKQKDTDDLFTAAYAHKNERYTIINKSAIYYVLGDNRRVIDPIGLESEKLGGYLSFTMADRYFAGMVTPILKGLGVLEFEYLSSLLAESLYLFEPEIRDRFALLADVGHITTSVALIRGDGILYQKSFSYGGGHITADLSHYLDIDYQTAELLKRRINLGIKTGTDDHYEIAVERDLMQFPVKKCNGIVCEALDVLSEMIDEVLGGCQLKYPDYLPLNLTGGGISYMRGAREYVANRLNRVIEPVAPKLPGLNKPTMSSQLGLLNMALNTEPPVTNIFKKIFG